MEALKEKIKKFPSDPGVYQMLNETGIILYVGKAANIKKRVRQYFQSNLPRKTAVLMSQVTKIDTIITASEAEALILEATLIKKHRPRYNVLLRDDKSYPYLYLSGHSQYPRLDFHRGSKRAKGRYFGPYPSPGAVRDSLNLLQKLFKIRQCNDTFFKNRSRPCLQYQIKRCTAPCVGYIDVNEYQQSVKHAVLFLQGKNQEIIDALVKQMEQASVNQEYEQAALYRDQVASLRKVQSQQYVANSEGDIDIICVTQSHGVNVVGVSSIRAGRLIGYKSYFPKDALATDEAIVLSSFMSQYYIQSQTQREIPKEIITNLNPIGRHVLETALCQQSQGKITVKTDCRGTRAKWVKMTLGNANHALYNHLSDKVTIYQRFEALQKLLSFENIPQRLECFDISHSMGEATVASCVVFDEEGPRKQDYRRFNIHDITPGDDYAAMYQALLRRYTKIKKGKGVLPDILIIDGGKGQLSQAEKVFEEIQMTGITLLSIAKGPERKAGAETLFISGSHEALHLSPDDMAFHLIQQIRDEAHRFAITGHRQQRAKKRKVSVLESIDGVGPKRRRELLRQFGGLQEIKQASIDELAKINGISQELATRIYAALHGTGSASSE